jgi:hypothetical protein
MIPIHAIWEVRMNRCHHKNVALCVVVSSLSIVFACSRGSAPVAPSAATAGAPGQALLTHGERLEAIRGSGTGIVNVTSTAAVDGSFTAQINVNVHDAPPNTTFYIQRAPEIGRALGSDGICQRASGEFPWNQPPAAPSFVTFPLPAAGPLVTLITSAGGAGATHIDFAAATILDGTKFDVMFRLIDDLTNPANDLRTGCFTVEVK